MNVISIKKIKDFGKKYADSRQPLLSWFHEAGAADWEDSQDIKSLYPSASFLGGNRYRLVTKISYRYKTVLIKWIGTHAEYDKKDFSGGKS